MNSYFVGQGARFSYSPQPASSFSLPVYRKTKLIIAERYFERASSFYIFAPIIPDPSHEANNCCIFFVKWKEGSGRKAVFKALNACLNPTYSTQSDDNFLHAIACQAAGPMRLNTDTNPASDKTVLHCWIESEFGRKMDSLLFPNA